MKNTKKYLTFIFPVEKEITRIDRNGGEITKNIFCRLKFARLMASSLSNLVNNHSEGIHKIKCKFWHYGKKYETCGIKHKYCSYFLEYTKFKDDLTDYKCSCSNYEPGNIWAWSCSFSFHTQTGKARSFKIDQIKIRSFNWYRYVINGRKRY